MLLAILISNQENWKFQAPPYLYKNFTSITTRNIEKSTIFNFKVKSGNRYLGGFVGEKDLETQWVKDKIHSWASAIEELSTIAMFIPQTAYAAVQRALQHRWNFLQRVMPNLNELFGQLETKIVTFLNKLLGSIATSTLRSWTSVPIKLGGTAMPNPTTTSSQS